MATAIDASSAVLATEKDVYKIQNGDYTTPYGTNWNNLTLNYGGTRASSTSDKLVTKTTANKFGFCVNKYESTNNKSGITYGANQLVQLRDLIPDQITGTDLSATYYTFNKLINTVTCYNPSGLSSLGNLKSWLDVTTTSGDTLWNYIKELKFFLTTGTITAGAVQNYTFVEDQTFILLNRSSGSSSNYYVIYNEHLDNNQTTAVALPLYTGSNGSSPTYLLCDLNVGSTNNITYGQGCAIKTVYLHLNIIQNYGQAYVLNIPLTSVGLVRWDTVTPYESLPEDWQINHYQGSLTNT